MAYSTYLEALYVEGGSLEAVWGAGEIVRGYPLHQTFKISNTLRPSQKKFFLSIVRKVKKNNWHIKYRMYFLSTTHQFE